MDPLSQLFAETGGHDKTNRSGLFGDDADAKRLFNKIWDTSEAVAVGPALTPASKESAPEPVAEDTAASDKFLSKALGALTAPDLVTNAEEQIDQVPVEEAEAAPVTPKVKAGPARNLRPTFVAPTVIDEKVVTEQPSISEGVARSLIDEALADHTDRLSEAVATQIELLVENQMNLLAESAKTSSAEVDKKIDKKFAALIKKELPRVIREELKGAVSNEVVKAVAAAIPKESAAKLTKMEKALNRMTSKFEALEPRMSKIEGAMESMGREIVFNVPENAFNFTMPEREMTVKVDAPNVVFDKDSFNMNFHKDSKRKPNKKIEFARDKDNNLTGATMVDVAKDSSEKKPKQPIHPDVAKFMPKKEDK